MPPTKGRTLFEILTKPKDKTPLELKYFNPLQVKVGQTISFSHDPDISGVNFVVEKLAVYETMSNGQKYFHNDVLLKGVSLSWSEPMRLRLRLVPDHNTSNELGCKIQLLHHYYEMGYDEGFHKVTLADPSGEFHINQDDAGNELTVPRKYWRVEDAKLPWHAQVTMIVDKNGDGKVEESELEKFNITYWDYWRLTEGETAEQKKTEYLFIEMKNSSKYFMFFRGGEVPANDVLVI